MKKDFIHKYFNDIIEYPNPANDYPINDIFGPSDYALMPPGTLFTYISSTFLNGWINYVNLINVQAITRYTNQTKKMVEKFNNIDGFRTHTRLSKITGDDILVLAKSKDGMAYWYFCFDQDVSDCDIGRFSVKDKEDVVIKEFVEYANDLSKRLSVDYEVSDVPIQSVSVDINKIGGWISF
jgi:hypothetical protein